MNYMVYKKAIRKKNLGFFLSQNHKNKNLLHQIKQL